MLKGLKALLAGIVAGTALGVLFSPGKGDEIRKNIKKEIDEGGTGFNSIGSTLKHMGKDMSTTAREAYQDLSETEMYQEAQRKGKDLYDENLSAAQKRKVKKTIKDAKKSVNKAKKTVKKATSKAKKTVDKAKKEVNKRTK